MCGTDGMDKSHLWVEDNNDNNDDDDGDDKYIMIQCLFVTFLFIPGL